MDLQHHLFQYLVVNNQIDLQSYDSEDEKKIAYWTQKLSTLGLFLDWVTKIYSYLNNKIYLLQKYDIKFESTIIYLNQVGR